MQLWTRFKKWLPITEAQAKQQLTAMVEEKQPSFETEEGDLQFAMWAVLDRVYEQGMSIQSNYARQHSQAVCAAACLGFITTETSSGFGKVWRVTQAGLSYMHAGNGGF
jgi:hypothetical protein